jgi:hypothetical protein
LKDGGVRKINPNADKPDRAGGSGQIVGVFAISPMRGARASSCIAPRRLPSGLGLVGGRAERRLYAVAAVLSGTTLVALRLLKPLKRHPERADKGAEPDQSR